MTKGLSNHPEIISSIKKPIATKELLARLQKIADELSGVDQDDADVSQYGPLAKDLANPKLLQHRNIGIRAYACCALTDVLRLYAPEAPLGEEDLSRMFRAFFDQFSHLWDAENPYYLQQTHVLKRLMEVRSVILVTELPDAQDLISSMFEGMYKVASKGLSASLVHLASEMLAETISEADQIPSGVAALVIKKLTNSSASKLINETSNISNPAFAFSLAVCEANADKMSRQVAQMFSEMLDDSVKSTETGDVDYNSSFNALEKIHSSSVNIWVHVPELLGSVMGLISDELNSDDEKIRALATTTVGQMISSHSQNQAEIPAVIFVNNHKVAWNNWLKKSSDSSFIVRSKWVDQVSAILSQNTTSEIAAEVCKGLTKCLIDSSEKVRFSACKAIEVLPFRTLTNRALSKEIIESLLSLIREKHPDIRNKAITVLSEMYNNYMDTVLDNQIIDFGNLPSGEIKKMEDLISHDIPCKILELNYINDKSITTFVDVVLCEKILPFQPEPEARVARLCHFYDSLSEKSRAAFVAISKRQKKLVEVLIKFIDFAEEYSASVSDEKENVGTSKDSGSLSTRIDKIIQWLSVSFPDGLNTYECFDALIKSKNLRLINLLKNCINSQSDYKTVKNSIKELLLKLSEPKALYSGGERVSVSTSDMVSNMKILLYRSSSIFYNKSNIKELIKLSRDSNSRFSSIAEELINQVSIFFPGVFKNHLDSLTSIIMTTEGKDLNASLLSSFYHFVKKFPENMPENDEFREALIHISTSESPMKSRYCIKILGCFADKELIISRILEKVLPLSAESPGFLIHLSVIAEVYKIDPQALAKHSKEINDVIIEQVLRRNRLTLTDISKLKSISWINDEDLECHPLLLEKLITLRLVVNRLRGSAFLETDKQYLIAAAEKPIKLLCSVINNNGEITKSAINTPESYRSRLQLSCGYLLLKLAKIPSFNSLVNNDAITKMGNLLHHEQIEVRKRFLAKLEKCLNQDEISDRFFPLPFLLGHEPDQSLKSSAQTWIKSHHKRMEAKNDTSVEKSIVRLIYIVAHDERFENLISDDTEDLNGIKAYSYAIKYVLMFLETVAGEANVSLLYYLSSRVKQYRDANLDASAYEQERLASSTLGIYRISELFQLCIKELADSKGWNIQTWPGKFNLPSDLFSPMESYSEAQKFISKVYIPDNLQIELRKLLRKSPGQKPKAKATRKAPIQSKSTKSVKKKAATKKREQVEPVATRVSKRAKKQVDYGLASGSSESESEEWDSDSSFA